MFDIKFEMNIQWMEKKCFMICTLQNTINSYFRVYKKNILPPRFDLV